MKPSVDIVIPVYNEESVLPRSILLLVEFVNKNISNPWRIVIADNGSTDNTKTVSEALGQRHPGVEYLQIPRKGRGIALKTAWLDSTADIVMYMDADLSTELTALPPTLNAIENGAHIVIGNRFHKNSQTTRSFKRTLISFLYNLLIKSFFLSSFSDAQCGFKALTKHSAQLLLPVIKNNNWFLDTEMLIIADHNNFIIKQIPVTWIEDTNSTVNIIKTATEDIRGLLRLRFTKMPQLTPPYIKPEESKHVGDHIYK
ncbi:MAG TPA: glycosyl transferase [Dehalococcoidia bacterium]|nr:glycosyl transferase [Dehalococcoidia bacterium]